MNREKGIHPPSSAMMLAIRSASSWECAAASGAGGGRENSTGGGIGIAAPSGIVRGIRYTFASVAARQGAGRFSGEI